MNKSQRGFAALETILIVIVFAVIGGIGWYVWSSNNKTNEVLSNADAANSSVLQKATPIKTYEDCVKSKVTTVDKKAFPQTCTTKLGKKFTDPTPAANWKSYANKAGKYSLKHPSAWDAKICEPSQTDQTLYLGPTKSSSVICGSEHFSQIIFISTPAVPTQSEQDFDTKYYGKLTSKKVIVDGVSGTRRSGELKATLDVPGMSEIGTKYVTYVFLKPGRSYIAVYIQTPKGDYAEDNLAEFDYMVQKTLKLSN